MIFVFSFAGAAVFVIVLASRRSLAVVSTRRHCCHAECVCAVEFINECEEPARTNNAYTHRNQEVIRAHHEEGVVPEEFVPIAAQVLGICVTKVNVKAAS